jgi:hypothetical protein
MDRIYRMGKRKELTGIRGMEGIKIHFLSPVSPSIPVKITPYPVYPVHPV